MSGACCARANAAWGDASTASSRGSTELAIPPLNGLDSIASNTWASYEKLSISKTFVRTKKCFTTTCISITAPMPAFVFRVALVVAARDAGA